MLCKTYISFHDIQPNYLATEIFLVKRQKYFGCDPEARVANWVSLLPGEGNNSLQLMAAPALMNTTWPLDHIFYKLVCLCVETSEYVLLCTAAFDSSRPSDFWPIDSQPGSERIYERWWGFTHSVPKSFSNSILQMFCEYSYPPLCA